ncbi:HpcH/HpaI aldolase/citrate lyase family protein [Geodermatophilus sp. URMC 64]
MDVARRRSCLSVPAADERKIARALAGPADEIVFDLEDSVPADAKDDARHRLGSALREELGGAGRRMAVRVNAARSPWCHRDLEAVADLPGVTSVVVPKVECAGDMAFVDRLLDGVEAAAGRGQPVGVQALVETATGLANVLAIAAAGERLEALILGYADLAASLGACSPPERRLDLWLPAQQAVLVAARAAGVQAIDGPHLGVEVDDGLAAGVQRARDLGFDGKWAIHPRQVDVLNAAFTPTQDEVDHATRVLAALTEAHGRGAGAARLDGQMLDEAVAVAARRVLARAPRP